MNAGGEALSARAEPGALRVLIIDDDRVDRHAVRRGLKAAGVDAAVLEAGSAQEAAAPLEGAIDCIFLDYNIPGSDGLSLLRQLRDRLPLTPVVMLTGQGDEQVAVELMKAGAVDYLPKAGLTPERLASSLRYAVELARAESFARRAQEELRESAERSRFLAEASAALAGLADVGEALREVARLAIPLLGESCLVYVTAAPDRPLVVTAGTREDGAAARSGALALAAESVVAQVLASDATWLGAGSDRPLTGDAGLDCSASANPAASVLAVPLRSRREALGVIAFARQSERAGFTPADVELAEDLARRVAITCENARLFEAAEAARAEAEAARAEAEEANRAKSEFLARMSHDLRTPLNAIGGYADLMELGIQGPVTEAQQESLGRIQRAKGHLLTLINDILSFARLEAGQVTIEPVDLPVGVVLTELASLVEPLAAARGLRYEWQCEDPSLAVRADRERLAQVLLNLVTNAVKFTEPPGTVRVRCRSADDAVQIEVEDTGVGIPADRLPTIFEPFVQAGRTASEPREGVGLGLAISRELLRRMAGELTVRSEVGKGSVFCARLPTARSA